MTVNRALVLVESPTAHGLQGRLIDDRLAPADWVSVEVRFGVPPEYRSMSGRERFALISEEPARREAFLCLSASAVPSSIIRLDHVRGDFDPETSRGFVSAYGGLEVCSPSEAAEVMSLPHELRSEDADGEALWRPRELSAFDLKVRSLVRPEWTDRQFWAGYLRALEFEGECAEAEAREQPDEALIYVLGPDQAVLLETHGAFLFYVDGPDCRDAGVRPLPKERGIYFVTGKPWSYGPDMDNDYDSGFDVKSAVAAAAEHYARFGAGGPDQFAETMAEYDADYEAMPAPAM